MTDGGAGSAMTWVVDPILSSASEDKSLESFDWQALQISSNIITIIPNVFLIIVTPYRHGDAETRKCGGADAAFYTVMSAPIKIGRFNDKVSLYPHYAPTQESINNSYL